MALSKLNSFSKISTCEKIDKVLGIIHGVSVITAGPAEGHDLIIDITTLSQIEACAKEFTGGIKVRMNHPAGSGISGDVRTIAASLKNPRIEGKNVRGDLHLLKSDSNYAKILELAETQPENFGLSLVFGGPSEQADDLKLARCTEIYACDLVDAPAANPTGLFSKKEPMSKIKFKNGTDGEHHAECLCAECSKKMSDPRTIAILSALGLPETATADEIKGKFITLLSKPAPTPAETILVKLQDGTTKTLSGSEIATALENSNKLIVETTQKLQKAERDGLISKMDKDGRVPMNPETGVAYTLVQLQALDMPMLKVLAANAPVLPMEAKAIFRGDSKPKLAPLNTKDMTGSQRATAASNHTVAALERNGYGSLAEMKARHNLN